MARSSGRKKSSKKGHELTQRFLYFNLRNTATSPTVGRFLDSHVIDLGLAMSTINRRLYRQGRLYHVANAQIIDTQGDTKIRLATLPQVWTTTKAWTNMYNAWKDQRARTLENSPSNVTGKWADFKVWMSQQHLIDGQVYPVNSDLTDVPLPEDWDISDVSYVKAAGGIEYASQPLWMLGNHSTTNTPTDPSGVGVLKSLEEILAIPPESPGLPADFSSSIILSMNPNTGADLQDDILLNISTDNDLPPYDGTVVLGATSTALDTNTFVAREAGWSAVGIASLPVMGFPVPLGLLEVRMDDKIEGNAVGLIFELVPGTYKGIHAEAF
jgi:hypothetical protein